MLSLRPNIEREFSDLDAGQIDLLEGHFELLQKWNENINLVSRASLSEAFGRHYADSIHLSQFVKRHCGGRMIDIGTGGGFPGVVMAILYPGVAVRVYEKSLKKLSFLSAVVVELGLNNLEVNGSVGDNERFSDLVVARAFLQFPDYLKFIRRHSKGRLKFVATFGSGGRKEDLPKNFLELESGRYQLPGNFGERVVSLFEFVSRGT